MGVALKLALIWERWDIPGKIDQEGLKAPVHEVMPVRLKTLGSCSAWTWMGFYGVGFWVTQHPSPGDFSHIPMLGLFPNEVQYERGSNGWCRMQGAASSRGSGRPGSHPG